MGTVNPETSQSVDLVSDNWSWRLVALITKYIKYTVKIVKICLICAVEFLLANSNVCRIFF